MSAPNSDDRFSYPHSPDDHECRSRACFDTNTWIKLYGKSRNKIHASSNVTNGEASTEAYGTTHKECPLDKDELGRSTWSFLHTMAANYPETPSEHQQNDMKEMMHLFSRFYPCDYCAKDFRKDLKTNAPDTCSQASFSHWLCSMHNKVNVKLGKPKFDCNRVNERWRDGWGDGSCD